ncbi:MAG TPA: hypothetical protein PLM53_04450 [Spirochaetota bacterium]|nr:hypothetical protein [Spirochaetota bacterium]HQF07595.1 hypothetical protein [Spirochaetota bacterium]HQH96326.1 hypothetical protein [Spirochaetota bacterium]
MNRRADIFFPYRIIITALLIVAASSTLLAQEKEKKEKAIRIKWAAVEGVIKYMVQMKNAEDTIVLDRTVTTNFIDFVLPPGNYRIRIGAINKFEKVSFWTEWENVEIRKGVKQKFFTNRYPGGVGLKINGGVSYNMLLPQWNSMYKDSAFNLTYLGYMGSIGFHFGESKYIKSKNFARFMGLELDGRYCMYAGKNSPQFKSRLVNIAGGLNLFIKSRLDVPINFYFRLGGGASYSMQTYTRGNALGIPLVNGRVKSIDPYAKAGVSIEVNFLYAMSLNVGTDYYILFYNNKFFQSLHYYVMLGFRI